MVLVIITTVGFMVGGFMLGPDLDIYSIQFKRWRGLRWLWLPYQRAIPHRSWLSHGPIIGTLGRVIYLLMWAVTGLVLIKGMAIAFNFAAYSPSTLSVVLIRISQRHWVHFAAAFVGLEIGAMSHSISDVMGSMFKRRRRRRR